MAASVYVYMHMYYGFLFYLSGLVSPVLLVYTISVVGSGYLMSSSWMTQSVHLLSAWNEGGVFDQYGFILTTMTWILTLGCLATVLMGEEDPLLFIITIFMAACSINVYVTQNFVEFYMSFEMTLFPILMMVIGWGYQPERFSASGALMMYTITGSLPLLVYVASVEGQGAGYFFQMSGGLQAAGLFTLLVVSAFLFKLPMFMLHMWLPKAHVEAPVYGSMFLAGTLLKLGGVGLIRFMVFFQSPLSDYLLAVSLLSLIVVGLICGFHSDIKVVIAYSSVAHMGLSLAMFIMMSEISAWSGAMILLTHGFSSSLMFYMAYVLYTRSGSRSLVLNQNSLAWSPMFSALWFVSCVGLMGGPPSSTLLSEILGIMGMVSWWPASVVILSVGAFLGGAYSVILFSRTYHNYAKVFSNSVAPLSSTEALVSVFHIYWLLGFFGVFTWVMAAN